MGSRAIWRIGGVAAGLVLGAMAVGEVPFLDARPAAGTHGGFVKYASGTDSINAYIAYPDSAGPEPVVLVIDEMWPDLARDASERLAKKGFIALAPDLLTRRGGTAAAMAAAPDHGRKLIASLNADTITQDLDAAVAYLKRLKEADSAKLGVIGFGWGGGEALRYAAHNPSVLAFVLCYAGVPNVAIDFTRIKGIGLGVYADRDGRITQGLYNLVRDLHRVDVDYRFKIYPNTSHGFLRTLEPPETASEAWEDLLLFLHVWLNK